jgi:predicted enzyme related to lactoylglutathione lyase
MGRMGKKIVHFEIMGKNAARLHAFYAELFDWNLGQPMAEMGNYAMVDPASSGVAGGIGEQSDGAARVTLYTEVEDLQATLDKAVALGGTVAMPPTEIPGIVTFALFQDPEGNLFGLTKANA